MPSLTGEKVFLRPLELSDAALCARWMADQEITQFLGKGRMPLPVHKEEEWIRMVSKDDHNAVFAICEKSNNTHIGNCGLHAMEFIDRICTAGILIGDKQKWGKGLGTEAMRLMCNHAFHEFNMRRVELSVFDFNERGIKSYLKLGFKEEGRMKERRYKSGRYADEILMVVRAQDWPSP